MSGTWIEREPSYLSFDVHNCEYCGKNIPRHVWLEDIDGVQRPFCSPKVAEVYLATRDRHDPNVRRSDATMSLTEQLRAVRDGCAALHASSVGGTNS